MTVENIIKNNGGVLICSNAHQSSKTEWKAYLSKGRVTGAYFVNVFRNGETFAKFPVCDWTGKVPRAPKAINEAIEEAIQQLKQSSAVTA